jgi:predicted AAA+ superfamily ATPase
MAYVYRHIRLDKNEPFYIGIGKDDNFFFKRAYYKSKQKRNKIWIDIVNKTSYDVEILFDDISWEEACKKEIEFINLYGRINLGTGTLANLTDGGEGTFGLKWSDESKLKNSIRQRKESAYWFNKRFTENHKEKISNSLKGKSISSETKRKISNSLKGEKHPQYGKTSFKAVKVIDTSTGVIYDSIALCQSNTNYNKLSEKLRGTRKNNTPIIYLKDYNGNS